MTELDLEHIKKFSEENNIPYEQGLLLSILRMQFKTNQKLEEILKVLKELV